MFHIEKISKKKFEVIIVNVIMYGLFIAFIIWLYEGEHSRWIAIVGILLLLGYQLYQGRDYLKVGFEQGKMMAQHENLKKEVEASKRK